MSDTIQTTASAAVEQAEAADHSAPAPVVHTDHHDSHSDTLLPYTMVGKTKLPMPLYTTVFATLGVITIIEVLIAEILPHDNAITFILLFGLSLVKAILVVYFYMHLREDNRIFAAALLLPVFVGLIATLFLAAVPPTGY